MIRSLSTSKTGLEGQQTNLDVISNNLANVSTNGFKRSRAVFADLLYQNLRQPGAQNNVQDRLPSGLQVGTGVRPIAVARQMTQGSLESGNSNDLAIDGRGFFQVLMPDGTIAYTRDGTFEFNGDGQMVTSNGFPLEPAIFKPQNGIDVTIGEDGIVSVTQPGDVPPGQEVGQITISTFINPTGLQSMGGNLYQETVASGPPNENIPSFNGAGRLVQGYTETSNVNVVQEMVDMITTQRAYEINSRAVQTSDEMLARLTQL